MKILYYELVKSFTNNDILQMKKMPINTGNISYYYFNESDVGISQHIIFNKPFIFNRYSIRASIESNVILYKIKSKKFNLTTPIKRNGLCYLCQCRTTLYYDDFYLCRYCEEILDNPQYYSLDTSNNCFVITNTGLILWFPNDKIIFFHQEIAFDNAYIIKNNLISSKEAFCCEYCDNSPNEDVYFIDEKFCKFICSSCIEIFLKYCWQLIKNTVMFVRELDIIDDIKKYILCSIIKNLSIVS